MKDLRKYGKYFLLFFFILIIYLSFLIVKPYIVAILGAVILSYIFSPVFNKLNKRIKNRTVCATLVVVIAMIIIFLPLIFTINVIFKEANNFYQDNTGEEIAAFLANNVGHGLQNYLQQFIDLGYKFLQELGSQLLFSLPTKIISFFVLIFSFFYMIRDGDIIMKKVIELIPLKKEIKERFSKEFKDITYSTVYGLFVSGFVQGILGALGFYLFGISNPLLWGLVIMILAILPFVGPILIWGPAALYLLFNGSTGSGILLIVYGCFMILLENIMRLKIISGRTKIHPILVVVGLLGGLKLFGIIGIILGPLLLSYLVLSLKALAYGKIDD